MKSFCYTSFNCFPSQSLYQWRDGVARAEDESTGYILPNKTLLEIGTPNLFKLLTCVA